MGKHDEEEHPIGPQPVDYAARYAALQDQALAVSHQVYMVVVVGALDPDGTETLMLPLGPVPDTLDGAMKLLEEYLGSSDAEDAGEMWRSLAQAEQAVVDAQEQLQATQFLSEAFARTQTRRRKAERAARASQALPLEA